MRVRRKSTHPLNILLGYLTVLILYFFNFGVAGKAQPYGVEQ